jgi:GNAT superfamily N-acetyltransferase
MKIKKVINNRFIRYRQFFIVECDIENYRDDNEFNHKKSNILMRRIKTIDKNHENKITNALSKMDFNPPFDIHEAKERLKRGYYFIIAEHNDEIIGWRWAAINSIFIPEIGKKVKLKNKEAYGFNVYIEKPYRNKGINKMLFKEEASYLHKDHFRKIWGLTYCWNIAPTKSLTHIGCKIAGYYHYFKFFFITIRFRSKLKKSFRP